MPTADAVVLPIEADDKTKKGLNDAEKSLDSFGKRAGKALGTVAKAAGAAALGLGAVGVAVFEATRQWAEGVIELDNLSRGLGRTVEDLSALQYAFNQARLDIDDLRTAIAVLDFESVLDPARFDAFASAVNVSVGEFVATLQTLPDTASQFEFIADAFLAIEDPAERLAAAMRLFGEDDGVRFAAFFEQGSAGIRLAIEEAEKLGIVIDQEDVEAARRFDAAMRVLTGTLRAVLVEWGPKLAAVFAYLAERSAAFLEDQSNSALFTEDTWHDLLNVALLVAKSLILAMKAVAVIVETVFTIARKEIHLLIIDAEIGFQNFLTGIEKGIHDLGQGAKNFFFSIGEGALGLVDMLPAFMQPQNWNKGQALANLRTTMFGPTGKHEDYEISWERQHTLFELNNRRRQHVEMFKTPPIEHLPAVVEFMQGWVATNDILQGLLDPDRHAKRKAASNYKSLGEFIEEAEAETEFQKNFEDILNRTNETLNQGKGGGGNKLDKLRQDSDRLRREGAAEFVADIQELLGIAGRNTGTSALEVDKREAHLKEALELTAIGLSNYRSQRAKLPAFLDDVLADIESAILAGDTEKEKELRQIAGEIKFLNSTIKALEGLVDQAGAITIRAKEVREKEEERARQKAEREAEAKRKELEREKQRREKATEIKGSLKPVTTPTGTPTRRSTPTSGGSTPASGGLQYHIGGEGNDTINIRVEGSIIDVKGLFEIIQRGINDGELVLGPGIALQV